MPIIDDNGKRLGMKPAKGSKTAKSSKPPVGDPPPKVMKPPIPPMPKGFRSIPDSEWTWWTWTPKPFTDREISKTWNLGTKPPVEMAQVHRNNRTNIDKWLQQRAQKLPQELFVKLSPEQQKIMREQSAQSYEEWLRRFFTT